MKGTNVKMKIEEGDISSSAPRMNDWLCETIDGFPFFSAKKGFAWVGFDPTTFGL